MKPEAQDARTCVTPRALEPLFSARVALRCLAGLAVLEVNVSRRPIRLPIWEVPVRLNRRTLSPYKGLW